jgi:hypothetical protein
VGYSVSAEVVYGFPIPKDEEKFDIDEIQKLTEGRGLDTCLAGDCVAGDVDWYVVLNGSVPTIKSYGYAAAFDPRSLTVLARDVNKLKRFAELIGVEEPALAWYLLPSYG